MSRSASPARPAPATRARTPVLLLWLLLINVIGVSGLAWYAMRGQMAEIDENRRQAAQHALDTLVARVEHAIYTAVQDPLLLLRETPEAPASDAFFASLRQRYPYVTQVYVLDHAFQPRAAWPLDDPGERALLVAAVGERIARGQGRGDLEQFTLHTFVDAGARGPARLFAFQALDSDGAGAGRASDWVLIGCDMDRFGEAVLRPLFADFARKQHVTPRLLSPETASSAEFANAALTHVLPGWRLAAAPNGAAPGSWVSGHLQWITVAAALGLLTAITLIGVAIHGELHRQHAAVELRNRFVANVSHELKTPLSLIRMYAETLYLDRVADPERRHEYHRVILAESERLSRMIGDVLDFSRLRAGAPLYQLTHTDLGATLREILRNYADEWRRQHALVEAEIADDIEPVAHDPRGITQIVLNLVDNAIKYSGEEKRVRISLARDRDRTVLQIVDHGPGLSGDQHRRLWRSIQGGAAIEGARGSGLGLLLVRQISDAHRAHFLLDRTDGPSGLTASVSFPDYRSRA